MMDRHFPPKFRKLIALIPLKITTYNNCVEDKKVMKFFRNGHIASGLIFPSRWMISWMISSPSFQQLYPPRLIIQVLKNRDRAGNPVYCFTTLNRSMGISQNNDCQIDSDDLFMDIRQIYGVHIPMKLKLFFSLKIPRDSERIFFWG